MCARRHLSASLLLACCLLTTHVQPTVSSNDIVPGPSNQTKTGLVETIRNQLMDNNYDYMSPETEESNPRAVVQQSGQHREDGSSTPAVTVTSQPIVFRAEGDDEHKVKAQQDDHFNELYQKAGHTITTTSPVDLHVEISTKSSVGKQIQALIERVKNIDIIKNGQEVSKNDLLYYINDDRFRRAQSESEYSYQESSSEEVRKPATTTTCKYKFFTVKAAGGRRRSGGNGDDGKRVFLREQRSDEVVIVRLDDQPFPDFRLPSARRQYMEEHPPADDAEHNLTNLKKHS